MTRRLSWVCLVQVLAVAPPAQAQWWQLEASGTRIEFDTAVVLNSASFSPTLEWRSRTVYAALSGSVTGFDGAGWSTQGRADASLLLDPFGRLSRVRLEVAGTGGGTYHSSNLRTASTRGELRLHVIGRHVGAWIGGAGATGWTSHAGSIVGAVGPTAGVWGRYGTTRVALIAAPMRLEGFWFPEGSVRASATAGPLDVAAYGGLRHAPTESGLEGDGWAGGSVTLWLAPVVGLGVAAGTSPSDLLQALPGGRYLSAGIRLARARPDVPSVRPIERRTFEREEGRGRLRFRVAGATRVDVVGEWTGWQPVPMRRGPGGAWVLPLDLPAGVYRFNLVVDGEEWIVPADVSWVDDGYGGRTGILIVP